jgi:hypothetical protein
MRRAPKSRHAAADNHYGPASTVGHGLASQRGAREFSARVGRPADDDAPGSGRSAVAFRPVGPTRCLGDQANEALFIGRGVGQPRLCARSTRSPPRGRFGVSERCRTRPHSTPLRFAYGTWTAGASAQLHLEGPRSKSPAGDGPRRLRRTTRACLPHPSATGWSQMTHCPCKRRRDATSRALLFLAITTETVPRNG